MVRLFFLVRKLTVFGFSLPLLFYAVWGNNHQAKAVCSLETGEEASFLTMVQGSGQARARDGTLRVVCL